MNRNGSESFVTGTKSDRSKRLGPLQITCDDELSQPLEEIIENGFLEVIENVPNAYNRLFLKISIIRKSDNYRFFI